MNFLISGCAGFIGYHLSDHLCKKYRKSKIIGFDNLNNFYSNKLKIKRVSNLKKNRNFLFSKVDLSDKKKLSDLFKKKKIKIVFHLAAQAGVRDSLKMPKSYFKSNFEGFMNIINLSKINKITKFIFASSSSVYGDQKKFPINEKTKITPKNIYAATKKINEEIGEDLSKITEMKVIGLRFFTVYGKYGRPDMSIYKFTRNILKGRPITVFNKGNHTRDFTHIDIIKDVFQNIIKQKKWNEIFKNKNHEILNIAGGDKIKLLKLIELIEKNCQKKSIKKFLGLQMGDIKETHANLSKLKKYNLLNKKVPIEKGVSDFVKWYKNYALN